MQQNEGKAVVTLFQDSAFIGGNSNCLRGNTEIDGDNIVRGKATVKVAKIEGLEVTLFRARQTIKKKFSETDDYGL